MRYRFPLTLLIAAALAVTAASASTFVGRIDGTVWQQAGTPRIVVDLDGWPTKDMIDDMRAGKVNVIVFTATGESAKWDHLNAVLEGTWSLWSACDDQTDCSQKLRDECARHGAVKEAHWFGPGSASYPDGRCEGTCGDGTEVIVICKRAL